MFKTWEDIDRYFYEQSNGKSFVKNLYHNCSALRPNWLVNRTDASLTVITRTKNDNQPIVSYFFD